MTWTGWENAWEQALYGPAGFYRRPEGPAGHFATSAQGLPGTGQLLAGAVLTLAARHGLDTVVELAAGRGELVRALHEASEGPAVPGVDSHAGPGPARPPRLVGLDVVDRPTGLPAEIGWRRSPGGALLPEDLTDLEHTLVLAHEWLDVVPCPVVARESPGHPWHHLEVDPGTGSERPGSPVAGADLHWLTEHVPDHVRRAEVGRPRDTAYSDLCSRVDHGLVLAVDYGHTRDSRPAHGSLAAYRDGTVVPPVPDGSCDLTAHVAVDTLGADRLLTQRAALHDLLGRAATPPHELSRTDPAAYLAGIARSSALTTLTAPGGLGGFWWALTGRGGVVVGG